MEDRQNPCRRAIAIEKMKSPFHPEKDAMLIQFTPAVHPLRRRAYNSLDRDECAPLSKSAAGFQLMINLLISLQEGRRSADGPVRGAAG
jgi:hypothetical protein